MSSCAAQRSRAMRRARLEAMSRRRTARHRRPGQDAMRAEPHLPSAMTTSSTRATRCRGQRSSQSPCSARVRSRMRSISRSIRVSSSDTTSISRSFGPRRRASWSRWPRAIVTGVRSSCETFCTRRSCCSRSAARFARERLDGLMHQYAPPRVPDHREEHRRHERHLEQLAPKLQPFERVGEDRGARGDDDRLPSTAAVVAGDHTRKP